MDDQNNPNPSSDTVILAEEKTNAQLKEELVSLGYPQEAADKIPNTRAIIIPMIDAFKAKKEAEDALEASKRDAPVIPDNQAVLNIEPKVDPKEDRQIEDQWKAKAKRQWDYWDSQPKVKILVPLVGTEKQGVVKFIHEPGLGREVPVAISGAVQPVTENGAQWIIPKGVYMDVPKPVADLIQAKYQQTSEAGANMLIDRVDPTTGKSIREQL